MLRVQVLQAVVFDHASWDQETGTIDPAIVVRGELPAHARPFVVDRIYRGPQGYYDESFALVSPTGDVIYEHPYARVHLRGEMYEDRFRDEVKAEIEIATPEEHALVLLMNDIELGRIPAFVDAPESVAAAGALEDVVEATLKKSAILWVTIPQPRGGEVTRPAWFVYQDGKVFVLTGPDEQDLTNIAQADEVTLTVRSKEIRSQIGRLPATVRVVDNDSEEFDRVAQSGVGTRLNLEDFPDAFERWKATCTLVELTPQTS
jgi:hypothetical protein